MVKTIVTVLFAFTSLAGCRHVPETVPGKIVDCSIKAVQQNWPKAIGPANTCLAGEGDVTDCLLSLINPVAGITHDVIACVVKREGAEFAHQAQANPDDTRSQRAAERAREYLDKQGVVFVER